MACAVIFGGTGFIGSFFADFLLAQGVVDKVYLVDLESPADKASAQCHQLWKLSINII